MIVAHLDTGREWRGGQAQVALLMRGLAGRGATNLLLAPRGPLLSQAASAGFATQAWDPRGDLDLAALGRAHAWLRHVRPDVVHVHSARAHALGVPAARFAGTGAVIASRRVAVPPGRDPLSWLKYRMPIDRWVCVSEAVRDTLIAGGIPGARAVVVPSGVDLATLRAGAADTAAIRTVRDRFSIPAEAPLLVTVASLTAEKNHTLLLQVAERLQRTSSTARLLWIGDGPLRPVLEGERRARGLEGMVHLIGRRSDVPALVARCTLMLVASYNEGFCGAAVEAQALGIPVVATRVGGLPEAIADGETGLLVPAGDAGAMVDAVIRLLADSTRRLAFGAAGRARAERYDFETMAERTLGVYQETVRSRGSR